MFSHQDMESLYSHFDYIAERHDARADAQVDPEVPSSWLLMPARSFLGLKWLRLGT